MRLSEIPWLSDAQVEILARHDCVTLEQLASFELRDSMADVVPIPNLRGWSKRAREALGRDDPLAQIDQAAGHHGPVRRAGGKEANG